MNEIRINTPGKPFTFVLNNNDEYGGKLYFKGKIVDPSTQLNPDNPGHYMIDLNNYMKYPDYDSDIEKYIIKVQRPRIYPLIDEKYVEVKSSIGEIKILTPGKPFKFVLDGDSEDWGKLYFRDKLIDGYTSTSDKYVGHYMLNRRYREDANYNPESEQYFSKDPEISSFTYIMIPKKYVEVRSSIEEIKVQDPYTSLFEAIYGEIKRIAKINPLALNNEIQDILDRYGWMKFIEKHMWAPHALEDFLKSLPHEAVIDIYSSFRNIGAPLDEIKVKLPGKPFRFKSTETDSYGHRWGELYFKGKLIDESTTLSYPRHPDAFMIDTDYFTSPDYDPEIESYVFRTSDIKDFPMVERTYVVEEDMPINEIKINSPENYLDRIKELIKNVTDANLWEVHNILDILDSFGFAKFKEEFPYGNAYAEWVKTLSSSTLRDIYKELLQKFPSESIDEIKINTPGIKFPLFIETEEEFKKYQPYFIEKYNFKINPFQIPHHQVSIENSGGVYVYPYENIFEPNKKKELAWSFGWSKPNLDEIKVTSPDKPFTFNNISKSVFGNSLGSLYFKNHLIDEDSVYKANKNTIIVYMDPSLYMNLADKLEPYLDSEAEHALTLAGSKVIFTIKDSYVRFEKSIDEIKVNAPNIVKAELDGRLHKMVEVRVLEKFYQDKNSILTWVEYPKGYLDIMINFEGEKSVDHDVAIDEILEGYGFDEPMEFYFNAAEKFKLKPHSLFKESIDEIKVEKPKLNFVFPFTVKNKSDIPYIIQQLNDQGYTRKGHKFEETDLLFNIPAILDYDSNYDPERKILNTFSPMEEIRIEKPNEFYDFLDSGGDVDIENVIKNIKKFKNQIADKLGITDTERLNKFLTHYANAVLETADFGDADLYENLTLEEFINDIKALYDTSHEENWEYDLEYDRIKPQDIQEIRINTPGKPLKFVVTKRINDVLQGSVYFKDILLDNTATKLDEEGKPIHVHIAPDLFNEIKYEFPEDLVMQFRNWVGDAYKANLDYSKYFG